MHGLQNTGLVYSVFSILAQACSTLELVGSRQVRKSQLRELHGEHAWGEAPSSTQRMTPERNTLHDEPLLLGLPTRGSRMRFCLGLGAVIFFFPITIHVFAQMPVIDSTALDAQQGVVRNRLGPRILLGGVYALADRAFLDIGDSWERYTVNVQPEYYGVQVAALFPVWAHVDLMARGEYTKFQEWSFTTYTTDYNSFSYINGYGTVARNGKVPGSDFASLRMGLRFYRRTVRSDALFAASRGVKRLFWRRRVNRSGFNLGGATGPVLGWHKRVVRALPETWPTNEPIPESAVLQTEQPYTRWYWSASPELGWTFWGRIDVHLGLMLIVPLEGGSDSQYELASRAYAWRVYASGGLSCILGRTKLKSL